ncbi:DUF2510 domain-containing protein [Streptomyces tateyamensis]|uniref:DUF2510 domain-containing protein n=1 Tax=Streptomyces tateyamensis TaxID=565073 RepID=UPI0011B7C919|nr:DUF2510 domain-containing protein [Streptomyces tateyamensis]
MSNSTPPGWYPDPHVSGYERFWDGRAWTQRRRPLVPAHPAPGPLSDASPAYGHPAVPEPMGYGYHPVPVPAPVLPVPPVSAVQFVAPGPMAAPPVPTVPAAPRRTGAVLGVLAGALVLVMVTAAICVAAFKGGGRPTAAAAPPLPVHPLPSARATAPPASGDPATPGPAPSAAPPGSGSGAPPSGSAGSAAPLAPDGGSVLDLAHGWSVPLPSGWTSEKHDQATSVLLVATPYDCATPGGCVRGNFSVNTVPTPGRDPQQVARQAMTGYAPQLFGPLADHQELVSGPLTTAGRTGYAVRWHVTAAQGAQGFVLLVALPGPDGCTVLVGSVDDDPRAPKPEVLEQLVAGVRVAVPVDSA